MRRIRMGTNSAAANKFTQGKQKMLKIRDAMNVQHNKTLQVISSS